MTYNGELCGDVAESKVDHYIQKPLLWHIRNPGGGRRGRLPSQREPGGRSAHIFGRESGVVGGKLNVLSRVVLLWGGQVSGSKVIHPAQGVGCCED